MIVEKWGKKMNLQCTSHSSQFRLCSGPEIKAFIRMGNFGGFSMCINPPLILSNCLIADKPLEFIHCFDRDKHWQQFKRHDRIDRQRWSNASLNLILWNWNEEKTNNNFREKKTRFQTNNTIAMWSTHSKQMPCVKSVNAWSDLSRHKRRRINSRNAVGIASFCIADIFRRGSGLRRRFVFSIFCFVNSFVLFAASSCESQQ